MEKLKYAKIGILSFILALIPIAYSIVQTVIDFLLITHTGEFSKFNAISYGIMNFMFGISLVSFTLGVIAIKQKDVKKISPIIGVVIDALVLLIPIVTWTSNIIKIIKM